MTGTPREILEALWQAALAAADPFDAVLAALPERPAGCCRIIGAGKASARMAAAVDAAWGPIEGLVVVPKGYGCALEGPALIEAAHPVPDDKSALAAERALAIAADLGPADLLLCLISGGGSALMSAPAPGISAADKRLINESLLASGARIQEINCVRKHLSRIKGGRLALAAAPARVLTLAVSDVVGDDLSVIASGLTLPDPTSAADALAVLERYRIEAPDPVRALLQSGYETPKPGAVDFPDVDARVVVRPKHALEAAAAAARDLGFQVLDLGDAVEGEAREVGAMLAGQAASIQLQGAPLKPPAVILSGGETTVTVAASGTGGRNSECALGFALAAQAAPYHALMADTDGIDGKGGHAGALATPDTLALAKSSGVDPARELARNNSYAVFAASGGLIETGPTGTNVNDFRAVLIN